MLARQGKKKLGLGCAESEGPPCPDPESRALMSRPHGVGGRQGRGQSLSV